MPRKNTVYLALGMLATGILMVTFILAPVQAGNPQNNSSSNTNPDCIYRLDTGLLTGNGSCPFEGTPTILSQVKGQFSISLNYMVQEDEDIYREMVLGPQQCGPCYDVDITKDCEYDSNGNFVGGRPLQQLSNVQKAVILDLKNNFSFDVVCPFTGKQIVFPVNIQKNTTIGPSGSVNVKDLAKNTTSNVTNSISNGNHLKSDSILIVKLSPLKQEESGILVKDIQCKQGFVLLVKTENGHPSCVKPTSVTRLLAYGWITIGDFEAKIKS